MNAVSCLGDVQKSGNSRSRQPAFIRISIVSGEQGHSPGYVESIVMSLSAQWCCFLHMQIIISLLIYEWGNILRLSGIRSLSLLGVHALTINTIESWYGFDKVPRPLPSFGAVNLNDLPFHSKSGWSHLLFLPESCLVYFSLKPSEGFPARQHNILTFLKHYRPSELAGNIKSILDGP